MKQRGIETPIGTLLAAVQDGWLCEIRLLDSGEEKPSEPDPLLDEAQRQIAEYFASKRTEFDLPIMPRGSAFDCAVWEKLREIPYGEIRSYGQIAAALDKPGASRAVGGACSRNPLLVVVPCHRVVASTGKLTGFAAGMQAKCVLLENEGWTIRGDRVIKE